EERGIGRHHRRVPVAGSVETSRAGIEQPSRILRLRGCSREQCRGRDRAQQMCAPKVAQTPSRLTRKPIANHRSVPPPSETRTRASKGSRKLGHAPTFGGNLTRVAKTSHSIGVSPGKLRGESADRARRGAARSSRDLRLFFRAQRLEH